MKIVLVRPFYNSYIITPPLGLGYLSSILKQNGIQTIIIDALMLGLSEKELIAAIKKEKPDAVAITCLTAFSREVVSLSKCLKALSMRVIIGGVHPTFLPFRTLCDSGCDFVICGEGEVPLLRLIKNNFNPKGIKGIYHQNNLKRENKKIEFAEIIENINDLPFPDWEQMDPRKYTKAPHGLFVRHFPIGIVIATRGCPYECTFCSSPNFFKRHVRFRSPENIVDEIEYLVKTFKTREIHFEDDNLTLKRDHTERLCRLIIERGLKIFWACPNGIRADKVDKDLIKLMKRSGCYYLSFGIESASLEILKNIKKKISLDVIKKSIDIASHERILTQGFFVFGLPGETQKTIEQTIKFAGKTKLSRAQFAILDVLPGSEL
jgi:anaerobic magnesium-protoporphyrin IX monomethyl ester cyclase